MKLLIQLLGEQTMQNLLAVMALQPDRLLHLATPKTGNRHAWIMEALKQQGKKISAECLTLSAMPTIAESFSTTDAAIRKYSTDGIVPIVNFTGGTKLMSIGAYSAAAHNRISSIYVDTENAKFLDGNTGGQSLVEQLGGNTSFAPYRKQIVVNVMAVANGRERVTGGKDFTPYLPLADALLRDDKLEQATWEAFYGSSGLIPGNREPRVPRDWLTICNTPLLVPEPVATLGIKAGLLLNADGALVKLNAATCLTALQQLAAQSFKPTPAYFKTISPLQFIISFFTGGWWEVSVANAAKKSGRFHDLRWSAEIGDRQFGGSLEEDLVAVEAEHLRIAYFSCKRGGRKAKLSPQLEETAARAERLGGRFTSKYFCVCLPLSGAVATSIPKRARELGVTLFDRHDIITLTDQTNPM